MLLNLMHINYLGFTEILTFVGFIYHYNLIIFSYLILFNKPLPTYYHFGYHYNILPLFVEHLLPINISI